MHRVIQITKIAVHREQNSAEIVDCASQSQPPEAFEQKVNVSQIRRGQIPQRRRFDDAGFGAFRVTCDHAKCGAAATPSCRFHLGRENWSF